MATPLRAELVTPERVLFAGEAEEVSLRTDVGEIAFLAHHAELVAALDITVVRIRALRGSSGEGTEAEVEERRFAAHGGFVHVADNVVRILAGVAEAGEEIDADRARHALQAARDRLGAEGPARLEASSEPEAAGPAHATSVPSGPLSGAMLALLAPSSAEAAMRRAEVRLEAAGVRVEA
jgi:F-type H+-transporting ATPase subunit epsilon